jgi:hypothetical protein
MNIPAKLVSGDEVSIRKVNEIIDCLRMLQPQSGLSGAPTVTPGGTVYPDQSPAVNMPGIPGGGSQYQVLQRDSGGAAVWDWVRAHG